MGRLLYTLLWGVILYFLWKLFFSPAGNRKNSEDHGQVIDTMVLDPNCNIYIPRTGAICKRVQGQEHYFCSKTCLEEYRQKIKS